MLGSLRFKLCLLILFLCFSFSDSVLAQKGKKKKNSPDSKELDIRAAENFFIEGEKYYMIDDYAKAFVLFQQSLEILPDNAAAHFKQAEILTKGGEYDKALTYSKKALDLSPGNKYYYLINAEIYTKQSNFKEAARIYETMLNTVPNSEEYLFDLAAIYIYQGNYDEALKAYKKAEDKFGILEEITFQKQRVYLKLNRLDDAIQEGKNLINAYPGEPEYILKLCEIYIFNDKPKEAIPHLEQLVKNSPDNGRARLYLYETYKNMGEQAKAVENLKLAFKNPQLDLNEKLQIIVGMTSKISEPETKKLVFELAENLKEVHPNEGNVYAIYGDIYFALKEKKEARNEYLQAVKFSESNFNVWQNILSIELELNEPDSVIKHSDKALELFPNQAAIYYFNGTAHLLKKNYNEAIFAFEQGKKLSSSNNQLLGLFHGQLGDAYNSQKKYPESDAAYEAALKLDPNNYHVLNNYSYFLSLRKEKLELAKEMSFRLVKENPDNATFLDTHAWVLYMKGEYKDARKYLEKAIQGEPNGTIIEHYGDVLFKLGDVENAVLQWQKAKGLNETSEFIDKKIADRKLYE